MNIKTTSFNNEFFAPFIYNAVRDLRPYHCVELGTYAGFSAYCIGSALRDNECGGLICYDLWESYPFNHVPMKEAEENLKGLPVQLKMQDAMEAYKEHDDKSVNFLMVDISNDGDVYRKALCNWHSKLSDGATVMLEGGHPDRDLVEWMLKYDKIPIRMALHDEVLNELYKFFVVGDFPSITVAIKKERA